MTGVSWRDVCEHVLCHSSCEISAAHVNGVDAIAVSSFQTQQPQPATSFVTEQTWHAFVAGSAFFQCPNLHTRIICWSMSCQMIVRSWTLLWRQAVLLLVVWTGVLGVVLCLSDFSSFLFAAVVCIGFRCRNTDGRISIDDDTKQVN